MEELTEQERDVLRFEGLFWRSRDAKRQAIKDAFDLSATQYEQWVQHIIDLPAALAEFPVLVKRLRRLRDQRRSARSARLLSAR